MTVYVYFLQDKDLTGYNICNNSLKKYFIKNMSCVKAVSNRSRQRPASECKSWFSDTSRTQVRHRCPNRRETPVYQLNTGLMPQRSIENCTPRHRLISGVIVATGSLPPSLAPLMLFPPQCLKQYNLTQNILWDIFQLFQNIVILLHSHNFTSI